MYNYRFFMFQRFTVFWFRTTQHLLLVVVNQEIPRLPAAQCRFFFPEFDARCFCSHFLSYNYRARMVYFKTNPFLAPVRVSLLFFRNCFVRTVEKEVCIKLFLLKFNLKFEIMCATLSRETY